jgi:hypothetical protein
MNAAKRVAGLCALVCVCSAVAGQAQSPATRPSALDALKPYIGQWKIYAAWTGGAPLEARATYDWGLNRKFIIARTFVKMPDGREHQRYESVFADKDGQLMCHGFVYTGESDIRPWHLKDRKLWNEWTTNGADGTGKFRQSIELVDDQIHWLVEREQDGKWEQLMNGRWERMSASGSN